MDVIDLSQLTQDPLAYVGTGTFADTGQAEVRGSKGAENGFVRVDDDGDGAADMSIQFLSVSESDVLL